MKVPIHVVKARRQRAAELLQQSQYIPLKEFCSRLGVSEATARRDLVALARERKITRTWGGALVDFNQRFPSFRQRQFKARTAKRQIATLALKQLRPATTCFFDAGTTVFAVAEALAAHPVKHLMIVTNSLPVAEVLAEVKGVEVYLVAGRYLARQSVLFGEPARRSLQLWKLDLAFMSAEGMTEAGLWNSQKDVALFQRTVVEKATRSIFCLDAEKLGRVAPQFLLPWSEVDCLLTDATVTELKTAGIDLKHTRLLTAH
jgi:DeoR/GlpR family transcriptional regulator of sugar metabolism